MKKKVKKDKKESDEPQVLDTFIIKVVGPQDDDSTYDDEKVKPVTEQLFTFIDNMFQNKKGFLSKSNYERGKYYFMINRFMSINYPIQACKLSSIGIDQGSAISIWFYMTSNFTKTPNWMYVSTGKEKKTLKEFDVSNELIQFYCKIHEIDMKTFNEAKERYSNDLLEEIKLFGKSCGYK